MKKNKMISVKVTEKDFQILNEMRNDYDLNVSYLIREAIRKEYKKIKREENR